MHPRNKWEGLSNKLFWIVASKRRALSVIIHAALRLEAAITKLV